VAELVGDPLFTWCAIRSIMAVELPAIREPSRQTAPRQESVWKPATEGDQIVDQHFRRRRGNGSGENWPQSGGEGDW